MPDHISGNPNASIIMIGEKAADLIKATGRSFEQERQLNPTQSLVSR